MSKSNSPKKENTLRVYMGFNDKGAFFCVRMLPSETERFRWGLEFEGKFYVEPFELLSPGVAADKADRDAKVRAAEKLAKEYLDDIWIYLADAFGWDK